MRINRTSLAVLIVGVLLVLGPLAVRVMVLGYNRRAAPPAPDPVSITLPEMIPTPTAAPAGNLAISSTATKMVGDQRKVLVDMAHFTGVTTGQLQPLAEALAQRGAILDYWTGDFDAQDLEADFAVDGINLNLPDQSEQLAQRLAGAASMIVVTSFTTWSDAELAVLQAFVRDGGNLLIISDPEISGVGVDTTNRLAQPFGVVFEDGYLYDRTLNDEHFTHVPMTGFQDQAAGLADKSIFLYGSRSVGGQINSQMTTADSTLNSLRAGVTGFTTLGLAAPRGQGFPQNVMALGDLDVLTEPFISRHDNRALLGVVADFLAGSLRTETVTDFPAYLGSRVMLLAGAETPRDAIFLNQIAILQRFLESRGRTLTLQGSQNVTQILGEAGAASAGLPVVDYIYMADYATAAAETELFTSGDMTMSQEAEAPVEMAITASGEISGTTSPIPLAATAMPVTHTVITLEDGLGLAGAETLLILRRPVGPFSTMVAILGPNSKALEEGLIRLTTASYANCVTSPDQAICPFTGTGVGAAADPSPTPTPTPSSGTGQSSSGGASGGDTFRILVISDDDQIGTGAADGPSEADTYVNFYRNLDMDVAQWSTALAGSPTSADMTGFNWVIWSSGEAAQGGPTDEEMGAVTDFLFSNGGAFTASGRDVGDFSPDGDAVALVDVLSTGLNPVLADGLPEGSIRLTTEDASAYLIGETFTPEYYDSILVRGPQSASAGDPIMLSQEMDYDGDGVTDGFAVIAMSLTWLPEQVRNELMANLYIWVSGLE